MENENGQNKGQSNQGVQKSRGNKDSSGTSGDSKKGNAFMNPEEQKEISSKRGKPAAESGNRIESNSSGIQLTIGAISSLIPHYLFKKSSSINISIKRSV